MRERERERERATRTKGANISRACFEREPSVQAVSLRGKQCIISNPPSASEAAGVFNSYVFSVRFQRRGCGRKLVIHEPKCFQHRNAGGFVWVPSGRRRSSSSTFFAVAARARPDVEPTGAVPATARTRGRAPARCAVVQTGPNRTPPRELTSNVKVLWAFFFHGATRRFRRHLPSTRPHERPRTSSERESES